MMSNKTLKSLIKLFFWGTVLSGALLLAVYAHGDTKSHASNTTCWLPEGCVTQYQDNPYTYMVGTVGVSGAPSDGIVLRIQPLATYSLFTEDVLICDREKIIPLFAGKNNPFVLTYKTKASRLIEGVGCHELVRVDEMVTPKP